MPGALAENLFSSKHQKREMRTEGFFYWVRGGKRIEVNLKEEEAMSLGYQEESLRAMTEKALSPHREE